MNETKEEDDNEPVDLEEIDRQLNANPVINQLNGLELSGVGDKSQEGVSSVIEDSVEKRSEDVKEKSEDVKEKDNAAEEKDSAEKKDNTIEKTNETITEQNEEVKPAVAEENEKAKTDKQPNSPVLTLSDLFSDTASLTRTSSEVPEEVNTRLFLLNQQLTSDHPGILFLSPSS